MILSDRLLLQNRLTQIVKVHLFVGTVALALAPLVYCVTRTVAPRYRTQVTKASFEVVCLHSTVQNVIPAASCVSGAHSEREYNGMLLRHRCRAAAHSERCSVSNRARSWSTFLRHMRKAPRHLISVPCISFVSPEIRLNAETCITTLMSHCFVSALAINQTQRGSKKDFTDVCGRVVVREYCSRVLTWCALHALTSVSVQIAIYVSCALLSRAQATNTARVETDATRSGADDTSISGVDQLIWLRWGQRLYAFWQTSSIGVPEVRTLYGLYDFSVSIPHPLLLWMPSNQVLRQLSKLVTNLRVGANPQWTNNTRDLRLILHELSFRDSIIIALARKTPQITRRFLSVLVRTAQPVLAAGLHAVRLICNNLLLSNARCETQKVYSEENSTSRWTCHMCDTDDHSIGDALHYLGREDRNDCIAPTLPTHARQLVTWLNMGARMTSVSWTRCALVLSLVLSSVTYRMAGGADHWPHWAPVLHLFHYTYAHLFLAFWLCKV